MKKILLAEDDFDDIGIFIAALKQIDPGIDCYRAMNGQEIIDKLSSREIPVPDVIFLDINMPAVNGWKCLVGLKRSETLMHIPVVMYSTSRHQREKELAKELGAVGFFAKPASFSRLREILAALISKFPADILGARSFLEGL